MQDGESHGQTWAERAFRGNYRGLSAQLGSPLRWDYPTLVKEKQRLLLLPTSTAVNMVDLMPE